MAKQNNRKVAQPLNQIDALNSIRSFLGLKSFSELPKFVSIGEGDLNRIQIHELADLKYSEYSKNGKLSLVDEFIIIETERANNLLSWSYLKLNKGTSYGFSIKEYIKYLNGKENGFKSNAKPSIFEIEKLIDYYYNKKYNIIFRDLYHNISTFSNWIKPINPTFSETYFIEYFLKEINFSNLLNEGNAEKNLYHLYYGLNNEFRGGIETTILEFIKSISLLSQTELQRIQQELIIALGIISQNKKEQGVIVSKYYSILIQKAQSGEQIHETDYKGLIAYVSTEIINYLFENLSKINITIKEYLPIVNLDLNDVQVQNILAHKLVGRIGNNNQPDKKLPNLRYINNVLEEYNITPQKALQILIENQETLPDNWRLNVVPEIIKYLENKKTSQSETKQKNIGTEKEFSPNHWNEVTFNLFNYFVENYNATFKKQKFINIWFYLEYHTLDHFVFDFTKDEYAKYVLKEFSVQLKKLNKPENFEKQLGILNGHYTKYSNKLKEI